MQPKRPGIRNLHAEETYSFISCICTRSPRNQLNVLAFRRRIVINKHSHFHFNNLIQFLFVMKFTWKFNILNDVGRNMTTQIWVVHKNKHDDFFIPKQSSNQRDYFCYYTWPATTNHECHHSKIETFRQWKHAGLIGSDVKDRWSVN